MKKTNAYETPKNTYFSSGLRILGTENCARLTQAPGQPFLAQKQAQLHFILKKWSNSIENGEKKIASVIKSVKTKTEQHWERRQ